MTVLSPLPLLPALEQRQRPRYRLPVPFERPRDGLFDRQDVGAGAHVLANSHHLMPGLAADPQRLGGVDVNIFQVGNGAEQIAREGVAVGRLPRAAGCDRHHDVGIDVRPQVVAG